MATLSEKVKGFVAVQAQMAALQKQVGATIPGLSEEINREVRALWDRHVGDLELVPYLSPATMQSEVMRSDWEPHIRITGVQGHGKSLLGNYVLMADGSWGRNNRRPVTEIVIPLDRVVAFEAEASALCGTPVVIQRHEYPVITAIRDRDDLQYWFRAKAEVEVIQEGRFNGDDGADVHFIVASVAERIFIFHGNGRYRKPDFHSVVETPEDLDRFLFMSRESHDVIESELHQRILQNWQAKEIPATMLTFKQTFSLW